MTLITLYHHTTGEILLSGNFRSTRDALEQAANGHADLSGVNLSGRNLSNTNLDGIYMPGAHLRHCNLNGTNLSEAVLSNADFSGSSLYNACLCESNLSGANFSDCHFGATDIAYTAIDGAQFSTKSAFTLDFILARSMENCRYICPLTRQEQIFNSPPLVIHGLTPQPEIMLKRANSLQELIKQKI